MNVDATARDKGGMEVRVPQKHLRSISGEGIGGKYGLGYPLSVRVIQITYGVE